uniref:Uncharacterized protein n=1 Tax=Glossina pallidipes TaxID=7398 RepID=A0A1A9ZFZ9_GLOPL
MQGTVRDAACAGGLIFITTLSPIFSCQIRNNISYYIKYNQCLLTNISLRSIIGTKTNEVVPEELDDLIEVKIKHYSLLATVAEAFSRLPKSLLPNLTLCHTFIT